MTKETSFDKLKRVKKVLFALVGFLVVFVLVFSLFSQNTVKKNRYDGDYNLVENVEFTTVSNETENYSECKFHVGEVSHAETLAFFVKHTNVQVYIGQMCVYSFEANENDVFKTPGGTWVMIPLYRSDLAKEFRVVLTPLYDDLSTDQPEFFVGSEIAVHKATLHRSLPAMILSLCVIFAGVLLSCFAAYQSIKGVSAERLFSLGFTAISAGLWRISYDRVADMFLEDYSVFIYNLSIVSLMILALSMLNSLDVNEKKKKIIRAIECGYCFIYITQLALQLFGIADLRETLKLVHLTIIISAAAFVANGFNFLLKRKSRKEQKVKEFNYSWLLAFGIIVDLVLYYFSDSSFNMIYTLIAILIFSVLEGVSLMFIYIEQKNALEEMEIQLTLSRTTTMMSQIRSHFVFNILNAISGMCKYDPRLADETIVRFSKYLRNNIGIMQDDSNISFETDLQQLIDYVALEQIRFGDKIKFITDIEVSDFMIPPLILQPVVENAIKHGLSQKQEGGTIYLRTRDAGDNIVIIVDDDGVGFGMEELEKEASVGIRNIKFRLEHLVHGEMEIQSIVGVGTTVTITIPKGEK